jgi:NAD(P)H-hydrate epimerase
MASEAAARTGAGYVTTCVPASLQDLLAGRLVEVMTRGLPDADGAHTREGVEPVLEAAQRGGALILGPGIGRSDGAQTFARELARRAEVALLLDADGLNAHAGDLGALAGRRAPAVLTPHAGELGRLLGIDSDEVEAHRLHYVREAAAQAQAVVVLKGDDTLVAEPGGLVGVSAGSTGGLATAGTGDVLSGVIAALLARDVEPFTAACAGVRLHARAGLIAAAERGADGMIARDVIEALPYAWPEP